MLRRMLFLLPWLIPVGVHAQTAEDFAAKYPTVTTHEVRPGILMIPLFTDYGRVCEVTLERRFSLTTEHEAPSNSMSSKSLSEILDELAPPSERGEEAKYLLPDSSVIGQSFHTVRDFQSIVVTEDGTDSDGIEMFSIRWKDRPCAVTRKTSPK